MHDVIYPHSLEAGNLVNLEIDWAARQELEFLTCIGDRKTIMLWESIDLRTFPSSNDFHGKSTTVPIGTVAIVLGVVGIPDWVRLYLSLRKEKATNSHRLIHNDLTVYDILVSGCKFQAFGCDMNLKRDQ